ncbi:hypothetical protein ILYODFUR_012723 [Ilyodon furcidens]|uniref:Uncharacterized protein n=1 Tax=Ilyodon furcidens TaxID=33524 RepID=A0ABV0U7L8_9TELE
MFICMTDKTRTDRVPLVSRGREISSGLDINRKYLTLSRKLLLGIMCDLEEHDLMTRIISFSRVSHKICLRKLKALEQTEPANRDIKKHSVKVIATSSLS